MPQALATAHDAETRGRLVGPGLKAFFRIAEHWGVNDQQRLALLGQSVARSTLNEWKEKPPRTLSVDQIVRLSYLVGIYERLERVFRRGPDLSRRWLTTPRSDHPFHTLPPLAYILGGGLLELAALRQYIDHVNGGPPSRESYTAPAREG